MSPKPTEVQPDVQPEASQPGQAEPELTYEQARDQLQSVVRQLESGNVPLTEAMRLWERGEQLAAVCQTWLDGARATIAKARRDADT